MRAYVKAILRRMSRKAPYLHNNVLHALKSLGSEAGWGDRAGEPGRDAGL
jgi:hypothetical protein